MGELGRARSNLNAPHPKQNHQHAPRLRHVQEGPARQKGRRGTGRAGDIGIENENELQVYIYLFDSAIFHAIV